MVYLIFYVSAALTNSQVSPYQNPHNRSASPKYRHSDAIPHQHIEHLPPALRSPQQCDQHRQRSQEVIPLEEVMALFTRVHAAGRDRGYDKLAEHGVAPLRQQRPDEVRMCADRHSEAEGIKGVHS